VASAIDTGQNAAQEAPAEAASRDVQTLLHAYEQFNTTGEIPVEVFDPDVEFVQVEGFAGTGTNKGIDGVRNVLANLLDAFESLKMRPRGVLGERDGKVLMLVALTVLGRGSRIQVKETMFHVWEMRGGRISRWQAFAEEEPARQAFEQPA
jgi:ketosteroid isomerase-like protein